MGFRRRTNICRTKSTSYLFCKRDVFRYTDCFKQSDYIIVVLPEAPAITGDSRCGQGVLNLAASGSGSLEWYDAQYNGNLLDTGNTYTTTVLTTTTTYYVHDHVTTIDSSQYVGETNNTINGSIYTSSTQHYLVFDCYSPVKLVSVEVNANSTGNRTITLRNSAGTILQSATVNIPAGISRITLNFDVPAETDLRLAGPSSPGLFRSNAGLSYPYTIPNLICLKYSSASTNPTGYYYFFYDWEVQAIHECISARVPVTAVIYESPVLSLSVTNESFAGANDGTITATPAGSFPFSYQWDANTGNQTSQTATGLASGTYYVTVTDGNGCISTGSDSIGIGAVPLSAVISNANDATCYISCDGSMTVTGSNGVAPYTYLWSPGGMTTAQISMLCADTYSVTVTDALSNTIVTQATVSEPTELIAAMVTLTGTICNGGNDGTAIVIVTGGTPPYNYYWSNGATTSILTGLSAGIISVTIIDQNNCETIEWAVISEPAPIAISPSITDVVCYGDSSGSITLNITGGTSPYSYLWNNGASTDALQNVSAGSYTITITDAEGCTNSATAVVNAPEPIQATADYAEPDCYGETGSISLNITGGTAPYLENWGVYNPDLLPAGTYQVEISDVASCIAIYTFTLEEPDQLDIASTAIGTTCYGYCDGVALAEVSGGTVPYSYTWSNSSHNQFIDSLCADSYSIAIIDANGCIATDFVNITQPGLLEATITTTAASSPLANDGSATVTATGGTPAYLYNWDNGGFEQTIDSLAAGYYCVTVTDMNACTVTACDSIICSVGTSENNISWHYTLYPNPADEFIILESSQITFKNLIITDLLGKVVLTKEITSSIIKISLSYLNQGIYFINIMTGEGFIVHKMIISR
ncbi:MAG: T9SS type A sorting domain-containing protein [Bacteroidia bacterium]|nr:T9SS type A sorting domain-containing protein [Bacteroidia bacterium]